MNPVVNGLKNGKRDIIHLFWVAGAIGIAVSVSIFLISDVRAWATSEFENIQQIQQIQNKEIKEDLKEIKETLKHIHDRIEK